MPSTSAAPPPPTTPLTTVTPSSTGGLPGAFDNPDVLAALGDFERASPDADGLPLLPALRAPFESTAPVIVVPPAMTGMVTSYQVDHESAGTLSVVVNVDRITPQSAENLDEALARARTIDINGRRVALGSEFDTDCASAAEHGRDGTALFWREGPFLVMVQVSPVPGCDESAVLTPDDVISLVADMVVCVGFVSGQPTCQPMRDTPAPPHEP